MSQITDPLSKFKLWFFRDMSDEQRLSLFALHGYPVEEMQTHAIQRLSLDHLFKTLSTPPVGAETGEVVADWRHKCAASSFHDHDGCSCSDAELRQRFAPPRSDKANGEDWSSDITPEAVQIMRSAAAPYLAGADLEQVDGHRSTYGAMGKIDHSMLPKEGSTVIPTDRLNRVAFVGSEATAEEVRSMASEILEWRKS